MNILTLGAGRATKEIAAAVCPERHGPRFLTEFAVDPDSASALRWASQVRHACRTLLGLRPPPRERKRP